MQINNLSDFISGVKGVLVINDKAELIMDVVNDKPVRLLGFSTSAHLTDFEIMEEGYTYYKMLEDKVNQMFNGKS